MALSLNFKKKPAAAPAAQPAAQPAPAASGPKKLLLSGSKPAAQSAPPPTSKPSAPSAKPSAPTPKLSFLKTGKAAQDILAKEEHKAEQASKGTAYRFWIPKDKEASITFLDGNLLDGILDIPFYYEHNIVMNGKYGNFFICTQDEEPCPVCEGGNVPAYVGLLTVIDHSEYVSKKDGGVKKDNVKIMAIKRDSVKMLQKLAVAYGGLRGCRFDVSRTGDKSPSIGNVFIPTGAKMTEQQLIAAYRTKELDKSKPFDYAKVLAEQYMTAQELRKLGFGSTAGPVGSEPPLDDADYAGEM